MQTKDYIAVRAAAPPAAEELGDTPPVAVSLDPHRLLTELIGEMHDRSHYDFNFTQRAKDLSLAWVARLEDIRARLRGEAAVRQEKT